MSLNVSLIADNDCEGGACAGRRPGRGGHGAAAQVSAAVERGGCAEVAAETLRRLLPPLRRELPRAGGGAMSVLISSNVVFLTLLLESYWILGFFSLFAMLFILPSLGLGQRTENNIYIESRVIIMILILN